MLHALWKTTLVKKTEIDEMMRVSGVPRKAAGWLCARKVASADAKIWLRPEDSVYSDPGAFSDMTLAVQRLAAAVGKREQIAVVGDYDVDGVTASAILTSTLELLGARWFCDIPHRIKDGYGLSPQIVERVCDLGATLIVTVDNGIRAREALVKAKSRGVDVIVTDHHEPDPDLPAEATAVLHWSKIAAEAELGHLSGAGVAWKLCEALLNELDSDDFPLKQTADLKRHRQWLKGLAALGALADVMPMHVENRKLIRDGLESLKTSNRPGWQALCQSAGVNLAQLTDRTLLWRITPRLNAAGRMESADVAFRLLTTDSRDEAEELARNLEDLNRQRRSATDAVMREAPPQCDDLLRTYPDGLVVSGAWPQGVVGIAAARLTDLYQVPVIVLSDMGDEILNGSGRSTEKVSLYRAAACCADILHHFGGHDAAIGCGVSRDSLDAFRRRFSDACAEQKREPGENKTVDAESGLVADDFLPLSEATLETLDWAEQFAPFGPDNPPLTFYVGPLKLKSVNFMSSGRHARLEASEGQVFADLVWFNVPPEVEKWTQGQFFGAVVELEANHWRGVTKVQLQVVEARLLPGVLTRQQFAAVYRLLRARRKLLREEAKKLLPAAQSSSLETVMATFVELGFAQRQESAYHVVEHVAQRDLRESVHYQNHLYQVAQGRRDESAKE